MNNKKSIVISIIVVLLLILLISGGTYAFLVGVSNEGKFSSEAAQIDINYSPPSSDTITGNLVPSSTRSNGLNAIATASLNPGSADALFNMYIEPTILTNLNIAALKWELEAVVDEEIVYTNSGDFSKASVGTNIPVVDSYPLSTDVTTFYVYIWLDESLVTDVISDASFMAKIKTDSDPIVGSF